MAQNGNPQKYDIDYEEIHVPIAEQDTFKMFLSLATLVESASA